MKDGPIQKIEKKLLNDTFKVIIVGGGSAGWMTGAYLRRALGPRVDVQLIESANISTIGVGEATFSTIRLFFEYLGLAEEEWMPQCEASYKLAIRFTDWNIERRHFYHPFQRYETAAGYNLGEWWLKLRRDQEPFDYACFTVPLICDAKKSPRFIDGRVFDSTFDKYVRLDSPERASHLNELNIQYPYGYHFDARLLAKFLAAYAIKNGVTRITDDVIDVKLTEQGNIAAVETKEHGPIKGDLFIDCTGFRGLLINKALGEPFISFSDSLLCDRAVAMQVPRYAAEGINPYTTSTALSAGWAWDIPLYHRIGTGYVYCSAFLDEEAAEREFRQHLGTRADGCMASHIKMRIGRNRNSWVKNCVAIGLSSGFVEPLESTGIFFIQHGIEELVHHFPSDTINEESVKSYNQRVAHCIDGVREFLTLHYVASTRQETPFWVATKRDIKVPEALAERLLLWRHRLPTNRTIYPHYHGFEAYSYSVMLLGLGFQPERNLPILDHIETSAASAAFDTVRKRTDVLVSTLPSVREYLASRYIQIGATA